MAIYWKFKTKNLNDIACDLKNSKNINNTIIEYLNSFSSKERWAFIKFILGGLKLGFQLVWLKKAWLSMEINSYIK